MALTASRPPPRRTDLVAPRSDTPENATDQQHNPDLTAVSANAASQTRGRGRPAKPKSDSTQSGGVSAQPTRKPSGRPKRNIASAVPTTSVAAAVKTRDRTKRSNPLPVTAAQVTTTVDGSRKRGRLAAASVPAKSVGRPKKGSSVAKEAADARELKKKSALLNKKVKEAADKLRKAVAAIEDIQVLVSGM